MFKEIGQERVQKGFARSAARVRNAWGAQVVYEERVKGVLRPPEFASGFFYKPNTTVWTFGRREGEEPQREAEFRGRDGR